MDTLVAFLVLMGVALTTTLFLMLGVGNYGMAEFGYIDSFPFGLLIAWVGIDR